MKTTTRTKTTIIRTTARIKTTIRIIMKTTAKIKTKEITSNKIFLDLAIDN